MQDSPAPTISTLAFVLGLVTVIGGCESPSAPSGELPVVNAAERPAEIAPLTVPASDVAEPHVALVRRENGDVRYAVPVVEPFEVHRGRGAIAAGTEFTCALDETGEAWCWGINRHGELGDGTQEPSWVPTRVWGGASFSSIEAGGTHVCAIDGDAAARCWGSGWAGALGDGGDGAATTVSTRPAQVVGGQRFASIELGGARTCAVTLAGLLHCWGRDLTPLLDGMGTPIPVGAFSAADAPCAIDPAGAVICWWIDAFLAFEEPGFHVVADDRRYTRIAAAAPRVCALDCCGIDANGAAWWWGGNGSAQLGDDTTTDRLEPVRVATTVVFRS